MQIESCSKSDYDFIVQNLDLFWDHHRPSPLSPILLYEFGDTAFVIRENGEPIACMFGLLSQQGSVAYVQLVAVQRSARRKGLASALYGHFISIAKRWGCSQLKAITSPSNLDSIRFHKGLGMSMDGYPSEDGVSIVRDYAGPGQDRVVFRMHLTST